LKRSWWWCPYIGIWFKPGSGIFAYIALFTKLRSQLMGKFGGLQIQRNVLQCALYGLYFSMLLIDLLIDLQR